MTTAPDLDTAKAGNSAGPRSGATRPRPLFAGTVQALFSRWTGWLALCGLVLGGFILPPTGAGPSICTLQRTTGIPCPGCGLTRSVSCFLQGHWSWAVHYHPVGPVFAIGMLVLSLGVLLPSATRDALVKRLARHDRAAAILLIGVCVVMLAYGVVRIVLVVSGHPDQSWWLSGPDALPPFLTD